MFHRFFRGLSYLRIFSISIKFQLMLSQARILIIKDNSEEMFKWMAAEFQMIGLRAV